MIDIVVCKADKIWKDDKRVGGGIIRIENDLPQNITTKGIAALYDEESRKIHGVLRMLPGGTYHRLLVRMLGDINDLYRGVHKSIQDAVEEENE